MMPLVLLMSLLVQQPEPVYHKLTVFVVDRQTDKPLEATVYMDGNECHEAAVGKSECTGVEGRHRLVIISEDATYPIANMTVTIPQYASIIIRLTKPKYEDRVGEPYSTAPRSAVAPSPSAVPLSALGAVSHQSYGMR